MPSITHDGRSFLIEGRRIWLVSGRVPYARLPRESWAERIHAAKAMGFNTVEAPVVWSRHEPRPGKFTFTGDADLRHFVDLVGKAGMHCILGLGPYIGPTWDFGGFPAWLRGNYNLRTNHAPFLEACSRYITAVSDQVKGWQVTAPGGGGPIVLVQCESEWTCGNDQAGAAYLGELTRYIREAGISVPVINSNNLWLSIEGQVDGWAAEGPMLGTMRQLASVRAGQPRVVIDFATGRPSCWGREEEREPAASVLRRLAEICVGGGQFNITTLCAGTNFGFGGGRLADAPDAFASASAAAGSLLDESGRPTGAARHVRRLAHFASRFGRVLSNLDPAFLPVCADPGGSTSGVVHATGPQGGVAFVFGDEPGTAKPRQQEVTLLLADGTTLPVPLMSDGVAWCLFGVNVSPRARLDYSNLSALGGVGQVLVLFGPAGSRGAISINGSPLEVPVPGEDDAPTIVQQDGLCLVVVNEEQVDDTLLQDDGVTLPRRAGGAKAAAGKPAAKQAGGREHIAPDGVRRTVHPPAPASAGRSGRVTLSAWSELRLDDYVDGSSARYASIPALGDLGSLGAPYGYGWYRLTWTQARATRVTAAFPHAGDRLHLFSEGRALGVAGVGPGASGRLALSLGRGQQSLVVLADNLGRFSEGAQLGEGKGLIGPVYAVSPLRVPPPTVEAGPPIDVLRYRSPLWEVSEGDVTSPDRVTWRLTHRRKTPVLMTIAHPPAGALLLAGGAPIAYLDRSGPTQVVIQPEALAKSATGVQIAPLAHGLTDAQRRELTSGVRFEECVSTIFDGAEIAFAKWEPADGALFAPAKERAAGRGSPAWVRATFKAAPADGALVLDPVGMTKGQVYVNGRHLSRYFVGVPGGKRVPGQETYVIPASWLKGDGLNELVLFDEHGSSPAKVRLGAARES
ncbi:MAG: beta-galactosidase [Planctomycetota bacterium]|nr:beta-galactosidase [Planctomycetota bacterium]